MSDFGYSYEETRRFVVFQCPICGKEFPTRRIAERHLTACQQAEADAAQSAESPAVQAFTAMLHRVADRRQARQKGKATP